MKSHWLPARLLHCKQIPSSESSSPQQRRRRRRGELRRNSQGLKVAARYRSALHYSKLTIIKTNNGTEGASADTPGRCLDIYWEQTSSQAAPRRPLSPLFIPSYQMSPSCSCHPSFLLPPPPPPPPPALHPALTPTLLYENINLYPAVWTTVPSLSAGGQLSFITRTAQRCLPNNSDPSFTFITETGRGGRWKQEEKQQTE